MTKLSKHEESPWKAVNQLGDKYEKYSHEVTRIALNGVINILGGKLRKAHDDAPLIFKGRIQYNPKNGKPITLKEWKKLEDAIAKYLNIEKQVLQEKIISDAYFLGTLINRIEDENKKRSMNLREYDLRKPDWIKYGYTDFDNDMRAVSEQGAGIYLQNVTEGMRGKIQTILVEGVKAKKPNYKVFQDLWDSEVDLNRDWDRVIRTETAYASNNGLLISQLRMEPEEEYIFMKGITAPDACNYCQRFISDKVVVLLQEAPASGDIIKVEGVGYPAIWPGKSNYGRKAINYWVATVMHPYCRCSWTRWYMELEELLREA